MELFESTNKNQCATQDYTHRLTDGEKRLLLACEYCGRPICSYGYIAEKITEYDAKATYLKGKICCGDCYKKYFPILKEECSICKSTFFLPQIFSFNWKNFCPTCWEKERNILCTFFERYEEMLANYLLQNNIKIDSTKKIREINQHTPLKESDVLYEICNENITVVFSCHQRIKISRALGVSDIDYINDKLLDIFSKNLIYNILAVRLSDNVIYILTQLGVVFSLEIIPTTILLSKENKIFSPKEELQFIAAKANVEEYNKNECLIADRYYCISLVGHTYYDIEQKCFFEVCISGSYHDGYEIDYHVIKREEIMKYLSNRFTYYIYAHEASYNEELSFIFGLPEKEGVKEVNPTDMFKDAIYGKEYM